MTRLVLTSGRGPAECRLALAGILKVMIKEAETYGIALDIAEGHAPDKHGPASAIVIVNGRAAEVQHFAERWAGTLLWVCPSPLRPAHRRKNWFVGCTPFEEDAAVTASKMVETDVTFETLRAGGPGGQHQNTTESAVRATHRPSRVSVVVRQERSQHRNKAIALARLQALLDASQSLAESKNRQQVQATHDALERGAPARTFRGPGFREN